MFSFVVFILTAASLWSRLTMSVGYWDVSAENTVFYGRMRCSGWVGWQPLSSVMSVWRMNRRYSGWKLCKQEDCQYDTCAAWVESFSLMTFGWCPDTKSTLTPRAKSARGIFHHLTTYNSHLGTWELSSLFVNLSVFDCRGYWTWTKQNRQRSWPWNGFAEIGWGLIGATVC